jgi:hypothetical protein
VKAALLVLCAASAALAEGDAYSPPAAARGSQLQISGYADFGFAAAQGNGTSFAPGDTRIPADYGVDTFATAVNSRGDVASIDAGGRPTNGFLPRSLNIGGHPSAFLSTFDVDLKYVPAAVPVLLFSRVQLLPRYGPANDTTILVEQALARVVPFASQELALSVGKFDSVFGIEYLENQANLRANITPSLIARYTTGQSIGVKAFYRIQIPALWSAISLNASATNGGTLVESLSPPDLSLAGRPIAAARLGYELNLPAFSLKIGSSGEYGPRNDQHGSAIRQWLLGADVRILFAGLSLSAEAVKIRQDPGGADKSNGLGPETLVSAFAARGAYATLAYAVPLSDGAFRKLTPYVRYEQRHAQFEGFSAYTVDRLTFGFRLDLWDSLIVKAEGLINRELSGLPPVDNDVFTSSFVYSF